MRYAPLPDFPGYRVSDTGLVESCWKRIGLGTGLGTKGTQTPNWHVLHQRVDRDGYLHVRLNRLRKKYYPFVHSLVLKAFRGPPAKGQQARHVDGDKSNNRLSNLAWGTCTENNRDRIRHGTIPRGENHKHSKLTDTIVREIRAADASVTNRELAVRFSVSAANIGVVRTGKTWTHVKQNNENKRIKIRRKKIRTA